MQTEQITISGMTCGGCVASVTKALEAVNGVNEVTVSLSDNKAMVHYDENLTSTEQLKLAVIKAGYGIEATKNSELAMGKGCCG